MKKWKFEATPIDWAEVVVMASLLLITLGLLFHP
jgi:hypothetical protein